ncbi:polysaccharide pyruvyl transferase family protein [Butyrivibrio sp. VCD2006]|uniref:polysaccharide pyruvyl transferase family protein n=1 Tax=Butyrivibrio sp. VCD2006 TaxID=1280664 RepID=UPI00040EF076|nr:polysaccharide pyruvyl transferase family protein [Butyrivibrio sp. VCD2006]
MDKKEAHTGNAAIVTFCNNNGPVNYGQILQCYAVQNIFEKEGYNTRVVLYQKMAVDEPETERVKRFRDFVRDNINTTELCYTKEEIEKVTSDCELLICGSDQIWYPGTIDDIWMLKFGRDDQRRMSYAASGLFFDTARNRHICRKLGKQLDTFERVTVRERISKDLLSRYTDKDVEIVKDPTLCLTKEEWDKASSERIKISEPYVLCYCLGSIRPYSLVFRKVAEKYKAKIYYIPSLLFFEGKYGFMTAIDDAGPAEFISLIKNAKAVCTDSYHGVILAHIYGIDCFSLKRMKDGAESLGGEERINTLKNEWGIKVNWVKNVSGI